MKNPTATAAITKLNSIEFFRVFLTVLIILYHYASFKSIIMNGTDIFFIIGGFFLANAVARAKRNHTGTKQFFISRFWRLAPPVWFLTLAALTLGMLRLIDIPFFLTLTYIPFSGIKNLTPFWYVSAFFWGQVVLFWVLRYTKPRYSYPLIGLMAGAALTVLLKTKLLLNCCTQIYGFADAGFLRAILWLAVGVFVANIAAKVKLPNSKVSGAIEILLLGLIGYIYFGSFYGNTPVVLTMLALFAILLVFMARSQGFFTKWLNRQEVFGKISEYAYPAFLSQHIIWKNLLENKGIPDLLLTSLMVALPFVFAIVWNHIIWPGILLAAKRLSELRV